MALKKGTVLKTAFDTYTIQKQRGSGGSGVVYEAQDSGNSACAIKVIDMAKASTSRLKRFKNEISFCTKNLHKNVIQVLDSGRTEGDASFYVMPLYSCTLRDLVAKGIKPDAVLPLFNQILDGVEAAHLQGVWHRDLKPENILCSLPQGNVVVADFGIAHFEEEELLTAVETKSDERLANFLYAAPEQKIRGRSVDSKADVYALGLMLHEMFTGDVPLGTGHGKVAEIAPLFAYLDPLIDSMRSQTPSHRPSVGDIKRELIARGNQFVELQRLNDLKKQVVPESEINDRLITDPIRIVDKLDYRNGTLTLKLNQPVNDKWVKCFENRATRFTVNFSSANVIFEGDRAKIIAAEHWLPDGVRFVQDYLPSANEDYAAQVREEHLKDIERRRAALRSNIAQEEARRKLLDRIKI